MAKMEAEKGTDANQSEIEEFHQKAAKAYLLAANIYPQDDENYVCKYYFPLST